MADPKSSHVNTQCEAVLDHTSAVNAEQHNIEKDAHALERLEDDEDLQGVLDLMSSSDTTKKALDAKRAALNSKRLDLRRKRADLKKKKADLKAEQALCNSQFADLEKYAILNERSRAALKALRKYRKRRRQLHESIATMKGGLHDAQDTPTESRDSDLPVEPCNEISGGNPGQSRTKVVKLKLNLLGVRRAGHAVAVAKTPDGPVSDVFAQGGDAEIPDGALRQGAPPDILTHSAANYHPDNDNNGDSEEGTKEDDEANTTYDNDSIVPSHDPFPSDCEKVFPITCIVEDTITNSQSRMRTSALPTTQRVRQVVWD
jgi:hypothetical protein